MSPDTTDGPGRTVVIDVSGARAYERAKARIQEETDGVDPDCVRSVRARIEIGPAPDAPADNADAATGDPRTPDREGRQPYERYREEDRELGPVRAGTAEHEALSLLADADADDRESAVTSADLKGRVEYQAPSTVSSSLGGLYLKRAVEREPAPEGDNLQRYWISDHGRIVLGDIGPFEADGDE